MAEITAYDFLHEKEEREDFLKDLSEGLEDQENKVNNCWTVIDYLVAEMRKLKNKPCRDLCDISTDADAEQGDKEWPGEIIKALKETFGGENSEGKI